MRAVGSQSWLVAAGESGEVAGPVGVDGGGGCWNETIVCDGYAMSHQLEMTVLSENPCHHQIIHMVNKTL